MLYLQKQESDNDTKQKERCSYDVWQGKRKLQEESIVSKEAWEILCWSGKKASKGRTEDTT